MTEKLYDKNSHLKEFTATVLESYSKAEGYVTVLDRTAFFPEGGGQPSDQGYLNDIEVYDVQIENGVIYHYTLSPFEKGERVVGKLNFERRFDFMQQHSAEHIVSGIAHRLYSCENVGFHLSEDIVTLDFDKPLKKEDISRIEHLANDTVFKNVKFNTYYPDSETLKNLSYRSKKELEGDIRIVEIENTDVCACCAPHVKLSGEIGIIKLLSFEALRGGVRIEMKAGGRAAADYNEKHESVRKISAKLCVKQSEVAEAVTHLEENVYRLRGEIARLKKCITELKTECFNPKEKITAEFEEDLDIKELQAFADALYKKAGGIRGVFSSKEEGFGFAICGEEKALNEFFAKFKNCFNVKGGGRNGMVQGTVMAAKKEILDFLKN